jgi:RNA polymerase sigma-70 factor (ECF subfamily)
MMQASTLPQAADLPDAELAALAARADTGAFEILMRRYNQLLFRTARSILKTDEETQDAVQEAYLNAWRALPAFRSDAKLSTWLVRIVINEALGRLRKRSGNNVVPMHVIGGGPLTEPAEAKGGDHVVPP